MTDEIGVFPGVIGKGGSADRALYQTGQPVPAGGYAAALLGRISVSNAPLGLLEHFRGNEGFMLAPGRNPVPLQFPYIKLILENIHDITAFKLAASFGVNPHIVDLSGYGCGLPVIMTVLLKD